ncbi:MAG: hypothetical protein MUO87_10150 [Thermoplasmata archaeon]|nr:hypothetical protein [Thermoplasmata archaeon]
MSNEDGDRIPKWPKNSGPKALDIRELTGETAASVAPTMDSSVPLQAPIASSRCRSDEIAALSSEYVGRRL